MKFRTLALALALSCGFTMAADAKTKVKNAHRSAAVYKGKKNKPARSRKVRPAVRRPKRTRRKH